MVELETLADLRVEIDRIDAAMHGLLMERGAIIDRLIAVKARSGAGASAFRPGREAAMMREIVERHHGLLPLDTVEGIWRIIISTFTYVQANYCVHADVSGGDAAMRDCVRFHFGFTPPFMPHLSARGVIDAVAGAGGDLGLVRIEANAAAGPWWRRLVGDEAPKIIARLPFVERADHPAAMPVFVLARPLGEAAARDVVISCVSLERWREDLPYLLRSHSAEILAQAADEVGLSLLIAAPAATNLFEAFAEAGVAYRLAEVGAHAARYAFAGARDAQAQGARGAPALAV